MKVEVEIKEACPPDAFWLVDEFQIGMLRLRLLLMQQRWQYIDPKPTSGLILHIDLTRR